MEHGTWVDEGYDAAQARFLMVTAITHHRGVSALGGGRGSEALRGTKGDRWGRAAGRKGAYVSPAGKRRVGVERVLEGEPMNGRSALSDLLPEDPVEAGVAEQEPDSGHIEGARLLANDAREFLRARGFDDEQIRERAEAYISERSNGDVDGLLGWIVDREDDPSRE